MRNNINGVLKGRGTGPGLPFANRSNIHPANSNWMGSLRTGQQAFISAPLEKPDKENIRVQTAKPQQRKVSFAIDVTLSRPSTAKNSYRAPLPGKRSSSLRHNPFKGMTYKKQPCISSVGRRNSYQLKNVLDIFY